MPDEHTSYIDAVGGGYWVYEAGVVKGFGGVHVLKTDDFQTFGDAGLGGNNRTVFYPGKEAEPSPSPVPCSSQDPYASIFDGQYSASGSVTHDPAGGNPLMFYEAENHCRGGFSIGAYYASVGMTRSLDAAGETWPTPAPLGAPRYQVVAPAEPEPTSSAQADPIGNAIPAIFYESPYLYAFYYTGGIGQSVSVARATLGPIDPPTFNKYSGNGAWNYPALGPQATDVPIFSGLTGNCTRYQRDPSVVRYNEFNDNPPDWVYILTVVCVDGPAGNYPGQVGWFYATATDLAAEDWSTLTEVPGSFSPASSCPGKPGNDVFTGWLPTLLVPGNEQGDIGGGIGGPNVGFAIEADGCLTGARTMSERTFGIGTIERAPQDKQRGQRDSDTGRR